MKNLTICFSALLAVLASTSSALAKEQDLEKFTFAGVTMLPVVTNLPANPPIPAEINQAFNKRRDEALQLLRASKRIEAGAIYGAMRKEFAEYPDLVRRAMFEQAGAYREEKSMYEEAGKIYAELTADPSKTLSKDLSYYYMLEANTYGRAGKNTDAIFTMISNLSVPNMNSNSVCNLKFSIVRNIRSTLLRDDLAKSLAIELANDDSLPADNRADAFIIASDCCRKVDNLDESFKHIQSAIAIASSERYKMFAFDRLLGHYMNFVKPPMAKEAEALMLNIVTNTTFSMQNRMNKLCELVIFRRNMERRNPVAKVVYDEMALKFIADNAAEISPRDISRLRKEILTTERDCGESRIPIAKSVAEVIKSDTNTLNSIRIDAAKYLSSLKLSKADFTEAEKILKPMLALPQLNNNDAIQLFDAIGNLYIVRNDLAGVLKVYDDAENFPTQNKADLHKKLTILKSKALSICGKSKEAVELCMAEGEKFAAAEMASSQDYSDPVIAEKLFREVLADEKEVLSNRLRAFTYLFEKDMDLAERYLSSILGTTTSSTNNTIGVISRKISAGNAPGYFGNYPVVIRAYELLRRIAIANGNAVPFRETQYAMMAHASQGNISKAIEIGNAFLDGHVSKTPAEIYQINMMISLLPLSGDEASLKAKIAAYDKAFLNTLPSAEQVKRLERVGTCINLANNENLLRALAAYIKSLYVAEPKKQYVVKYSEKPIADFAAFDLFANEVDKQNMDREYGGNYDFLVTDVATGNRGEGIGTEIGAKRAQTPTLRIATDVSGIHFVFEAPDADARKIEAGLLSGGSYEGYIAPGENQPYICFLFNIAPNALVSLYNTTYTTAGHRRVTDNDRSMYRSETVFTDKSVISYFWISWEGYATLVPKNGTVWDFENVLWGRTGSAAWNGTESIHGRSTWGQLVFEMPETARIAILRRQLFVAMAAYKREKRTNHYKEGVIDKWQDDVLGDPEFYNECVKPLVEKLDSYMPLVTLDMSAADVQKVADEALAGWRDISFTISRLRNEYLQRKLSEE